MDLVVINGNNYCSFNSNVKQRIQMVLLQLVSKLCFAGKEIIITTTLSFTRGVNPVKRIIMITIYLAVEGVNHVLCPLGCVLEYYP